MIQRHLISRLAVAGAVAACALLGSTGAALAATPPCTSLGASSAVFSPLGDTASYALVPGGSFENSQTSMWTLSKDSVVAGNEPWYVNAGTDSHSLALVSGGAAESPAMCISSQTPTWRFFAQAGNSAAASTLTMWATWTASDGSTGATTPVTINSAAYGSWAATPVLALGSLLPSNVTGSANLWVSTTGKWQIDDVYIDPYSRG